MVVCKTVPTNKRAVLDIWHSFRQASALHYIKLNLVAMSRHNAWYASSQCVQFPLGNRWVLWSYADWNRAITNSRSGCGIDPAVSPPFGELECACQLELFASNPTITIAIPSRRTPKRSTFQDHSSQVGDPRQRASLLSRVQSPQLNSLSVSLHCGARVSRKHNSKALAKSVAG